MPRPILNSLAVLLIATVAVAQDDAAERRSIAQRMHDIIDPVQIDGARAEDVLQWWSRTADIPLLVDWNALEHDGIERDTPISLNLRYVPAGQLLAIVMRMLPPPDAPDDTRTMIYEATPWYVQLMTKRMANRQVVMRVYNVGDLLHEIPHFDDAPRMDLHSALENTASSGTSSVGRLFGERDAGRAVRKTKTERGQEIAELIRDTIEPDIWQAHGGEYASVRYFNGRLIVNAPRYVHAQIGFPEIRTEVEEHARTSATAPATRSWRVVRPMPKSSVAGVQTGPAKPIVGTR